MAHVSSGQSITAALWNALDDRIANLEANALNKGGTVGSGTLTPNFKIGTFSGTTDSNGDITVTHGAGFTPTKIFVQESTLVSTSNAFNSAQVDPATITSTQFKIRCHKVDGTALTSFNGVSGFFIAYA